MAARITRSYSVRFSLFGHLKNIIFKTPSGHFRRAASMGTHESGNATSLGKYFR
jgi:hypothetical protein